MKWIFILVGAVIAWLFYESSKSDELGSSPSVTIPALVAPVVLSGSTSEQCVGKTDAQGNWYGVNLSGNCTIEALGGAGGDF